MTCWVRLDATYSSHPRVRRLRAAGRWTFVELLCVAKQFTRGGELPAQYLDAGWLAERTGFGAADIDAAIGELAAAGLIVREGAAARIVGWADHQEDAGAAERMARWRARRSEEAQAGPAGASEPPGAAAIERANVAEVFAHWQKACRHPDAKLTPDREAKIRSRLREGTSVEKAKLAIDGCVARGPIKGVVHDKIDMIFRNAGQVDDLIRYANGQAAATPQPRRTGGLWDDDPPEEVAHGSV